MKKALIFFAIALVLVGCKRTVRQESRPVPVQKQAQNSQEIPMQNQEGLAIEVITEGSGPAAQNGNAVSVHYTGTLTDGTKFDSSVDKGIPFSFVLGAGRVIKGWDLGVLGMKVGEKRKLTIQPDLGYGSRGIGPIPPNAVLIFEVELLGIE